MLNLQADIIKTKTSFEGNTIENITSQRGLHQLINEPTHILQYSSLCIDLTFTYQPDLVIESGANSSLHSSCHHQKVYAKFNLKICCPPPYLREVFHFKEEETDLIRRALSHFNCERAFGTQILTRKFVSSINLFSTFWVTEELHMKPCYAMTRILRSLTLELSLFYRPKIKFSKITERAKPIFNYLIN